MTRSLAVLLAALVAVWLALCLPAYGVAGWAGLVGNTVAAAITAPPLVLSFAFCLRQGRRRPDGQFLGLAVGMLVRMGVALGAGFVVLSLVSWFTLHNFLIWLVCEYVAGLLAEVALLARELRSK